MVWLIRPGCLVSCQSCAVRNNRICIQFNSTFKLHWMCFHCDRSSFVTTHYTWEKQKKWQDPLQKCWTWSGYSPQNTSFDQKSFLGNTFLCPANISEWNSIYVCTLTHAHIFSLKTNCNKQFKNDKQRVVSPYLFLLQFTANTVWQDNLLVGRFIQPKCRQLNHDTSSSTQTISDQFTKKITVWLRSGKRYFQKITEHFVISKCSILVKSTRSNHLWVFTTFYSKLLRCSKAYWNFPQNYMVFAYFLQT